MFAAFHFIYEALGLRETDGPRGTQLVNEKLELLALGSWPVAELFPKPLFLVITSHLSMCQGLPSPAVDPLDYVKAGRASWQRSA